MFALRAATKHISPSSLQFAPGLFIRTMASSAVAPKKVAVVLSGCGVFDGSEVHEASAVMCAVTRNSASYQVYAPDKDQMHAINHTRGEPHDATRNVLEESARIARGNAKPLTELDAREYSCVIFPGGFGAAKNLSTFAVDGAEMKVDESVEAVLKAFHDAKKPIGLCCIAPVLAAKVLKCKVTVGSDVEGTDRWPYAGTAKAIVDMGAEHEVMDVDGVCVDEANNVITTPAFMCETAVHEIHDGVAAMVDEVLKRA
eukprot:m.280829 g.280829  ORF g.280829 m.280829 type:complete len:257 (-) comp15751_c0_seq1:4034-4804(-)